MTKIIDFREKIYDFQKKNRDIKQIEKFLKERTFVLRLPFPLTIHTLIDVVERMGIEKEGLVLPLLKKISRDVEAHKRNV